MNGPLHYLGNRFLSIPDLSGRMAPDSSWLNELFGVILGDSKGKKFKRCFEPFSGCASWSMAAMERGIAEEYIINDSNKALINTLRLMRDDPDSLKAAYAPLVNAYINAPSKKEFFLQTIKDYNKAELDKKSLLLSFIVNHSWSGIVFHDDKGNIVYREHTVQGKAIPGYLDKATMPVVSYINEVDWASKLLRANKVTFKSGDFLQALSGVQASDFVALNPPYPENERSVSEKTGMFFELYSPETLHTNLVNTTLQMESSGIAYFMTYGFHNPKMKQFVLRDKKNQTRHFFRVLGYENCAWGIGLDQMYFSSKLSVPKHLNSKIIPASDVLQNKELTPEEALKNFNRMAKERQ